MDKKRQSNFTADELEVLMKCVEHDSKAMFILLYSDEQSKAGMLKQQC